MDEVTRDVLASTMSVLEAANGVNGNTPTELTKADIDIAVRTLLGFDAETISEVVRHNDHSKLSLIDLESYSESHGDRAQAEVNLLLAA